MNENKTVRRELLERVETDQAFFKNITTGDEIWIYGYDVETERHSSSQRNSVNYPRSKKARQVRSNEREIHVNGIFFYFRGMVHREWYPTQGIAVQVHKFLSHCSLV